MNVLQQYQLWIGLGFAALLVAFLIVAFFRAPRMSDDQRAILKFLSALCAGFAGALITGDALFKMNGKTSATEYAILGTAGCALFFVVWFFFPKLKDNSPPPDGFNFSVPDGWTFQQAVEAVVRDEKSVAEYVGFTTKELNAPLKAGEISVKTALDALQRLRSITSTPGVVRAYDVKYQDSRYYLTVRGLTGSNET